MPKYKKNTKHKTTKQKRSIRNKREVKKYIEILNKAYKTITTTYHDLFDKEDYILLPI